MATRSDWPELLEEWNALLLRSRRLALDLDEPDRRRAWFGEAGASEDELLATEKRLGLVLPESYRTFLACSNGWIYPGHVNMCGGAFRAAARVDRFERENRDWIEAYVEPLEGKDTTPEEHLVYGENQESHCFRTAYLWNCLQISEDSGSGVYLLNPSVRSSRTGEWEAWFFANWLPGACRYPSFRLLIEGLVADARREIQ